MKKKKLPVFQTWHATVAIGLIVMLLLVGSQQYNDSRAEHVDATEKKFDAIRIRPITDRDHYRGSLTAPVQVIIFSDTECPYCRYLHMNVLPDIQRTYAGKVVIAYRHHLRPQFTRSPREAQATECAALIGGEEKFWKYLDRMYQITPSDNNLDPQEIYAIAAYAQISQQQFTACLDSGATRPRVDEDRQEANLNDIITAPTVVVMPRDGKPLYLPGSYPGPIKAAIEAVLDRPQSSN